jgi:hypothetical protein
MCIVLLPPGDNPIAVNKYIICVHIKLLRVSTPKMKMCQTFKILIFYERVLFLTNLIYYNFLLYLNHLRLRIFETVSCFEVSRPRCVDQLNN